MKRDPCKLAAVILTVCIGVMCAGILLRFGAKNVLQDKLGMENAAVRFLVGERLATVTENEREAVLPEAQRPQDEAQQYSFEAVSLATAYPAEATEKKNAAGPAAWYTAQDAALRALLENLQNQLTWYTTRYLPGQQCLEDAQSAMWRALGVQFVDFTTTDNSILLPNGYEVTGQAHAEVRALADNTAAFSTWCEQQGIPFVYVQAPGKLSGQEQPANGAQYLYYGNDNADRMLAELERQEVACLDLRDSLTAQGVEEYWTLFYPHDGHWLPTTAFWAAGEIADYLAATQGWQIDTACYAPGSYSEVKAEGQKPVKGTLRDDCTFYLPTFSTAFALELPDLGLGYRGTLAQTYFYPADPAAALSYYTAARYGNVPLEVLRNEGKTANAGKKILLIGDSFSRYVFPYLALDAQETVFLYPYGFTGSLRAYLAAEKPDAVVMLTIPSRLKSGDTWFTLQ